MARARSLTLALAGLAIAAGTAFADQAVPMPAGTRVRVTTPEVQARRVTGTLVEASERVIVLAFASGERRAIPVEAVTRLERSRGRRGHPVAGAVVGGLLGGGFVALMSGLACDVEDCEGSPAGAVLLGVGLGALPGAGVGALIKTERWDAVPADRVRLTLAPVRGSGAALRLSLQF
jgi:hypothetical protein